jgi:membrane-bound lytic murein transglycosylase B
MRCYTRSHHVNLNFILMIKNNAKEQAMKIKLLFIFLLLVNFAMVTFSGQSWQQFLTQVRGEAIQQGVDPTVINRAFANLKAPSKKIIYRKKNQPEKRITFRHYRASRADPYRIRLGRKKYRRYNKLVNNISQHFGVSPCFIMSFWGLETSFGHFKGQYPVIQSLATLAYQSNRKYFFRRELLMALHILDQKEISLPNFKGGWAGGSGHSQFMPTSWYHYAVDYDGDNRRDIWNNIPDALASIANYVKKNGWRNSKPWAIEVRLPRHFNKSLLGRKKFKPLWQWRQMGVTGVNRKLPPYNIKAAIIYPYGGPALMVFHNFNVIMRWNRSTYFAGTIGYMAEQICQKKL